jgi:hypothetical protein
MITLSRSAARAWEAVAGASDAAAAEAAMKVRRFMSLGSDRWMWGEYDLGTHRYCAAGYAEVAERLQHKV